jgi:hypothetical protein
MTTAEIATLIAQNVNDNTVGDITPAELRAVLNALNENQQSGEFESTLTVSGGGSATLAGKLLYHKIGNIVSISGTIDLTGAVPNNKIVPSLPFAQDTTKPLNFTCTLSNALQYNGLRTGTSFNLGVLADPANDNKLTILLRSDSANNYTIFFSGHYVCV